jgi:branched-chain amino acid transport system ATP-binding protein
LSLIVEDVSISYGKIQAIWGVSLEVGKGEIVSLIGANGAGKSTLLRSIIGIVQVNRGKIQFEGNPLLHKRPHVRVHDGISYVPEGRRLFSSMTVKENLLMGKKKGKTEPGSFSKQLGRVYDLFPVLKERESQFAGNLSGGEQQMLAIGRAFMSEPKLMLLDELSFGLAPLTFERVLEAIIEINKQGVSILLAEQNAERALDVSSRSYVLENGRIVLHGVSKELIDSPKIKEAYLGIA